MTPVRILIATLLLQMGFFGLVWAVLAWLRIARRPALHWAASTLMFALSMALIVDRADLGPWLGRWLPNVLNVAAFALMRRGIQTFVRRAPTDREHAVLIAAAATVLALAVGVIDDHRLLQVVANGAMAWSLVRAGWEAWADLRGEFGIASARACAAPLWTVGSLLAVRALLPLWLDAGAIRPLDADGGFNVALMFVFVGLGLLMNATLGGMVIVRLVRRLQHLSHHDALTGVLNRRGMELMLRGQHEALRRRGRCFAMVSVDIDHFKQVNDRHGHAAGDAVLIGLAELLRAGCRAADHVGRMGGEEFCLLLPETDAAGAQVLAQRVLGLVRGRSFAAAGRELRITVSLGIVVADDPTEDMASLWRRVDAALYAAKDAGRDRAVAAGARGRAPVPVPG